MKIFMYMRLDLKLVRLHFIKAVLLLLLPGSLFGCDGGVRPSEERHWVERWAETHPLNKARAGAASGVKGRYIYVAGGGEADTDEGIHDSVEYTRVKPDGSLEPWRYTRKMVLPRIFAAGVVYNNYFYVIGGEKGVKDQDLLNSIERGRINPAGRIDEWILEDSVMATPRRAPVVFILQGRLYVSGGYNGKFLTDVESTEIKADGSLGPWRNESSDTRYPRYIHTGVVFNEKILLFGGHSPKTGGALDSVEWTSVTDEGYLDQWSPGGKMRTRRYLNGSVLHKGTLYMVGGRNSVLLREVSRVDLTREVSGNFSDLKWSRDSSLGYPREALSVVLVGDFIYVIGGKSRWGVLSSVAYSEIRAGEKLGHWSDKKPKKLLPEEEGLSLDAYSHFAVGNEFIEYGKLDFAYGEIAEGLRLFKDAPEGYYLLGQYHARKGEYDKATEAFVKANELKEEYAEPHIGLGIVHLEAGRFDEALKESMEAIRLDSDMPEAYYLAGLIYLKVRDFKSAKSFLMKATRHRVDFAEGYQSLGVAYYELKEYSKAIGAYKRALRVNAELYSARLNLAAAYLRLDQFSNAISEYDSLLSRNPDDERLKRLLRNAEVQMSTSTKLN